MEALQRCCRTALHSCLESMHIDSYVHGKSAGRVLVHHSTFTADDVLKYPMPRMHAAQSIWQ
jgi:hypothetical protein